MRVRKISAQCVLQFTPSLAAGCVLHRPVSRVIHCSELYFFIGPFHIVLPFHIAPLWVRTYLRYISVHFGAAVPESEFEARDGGYVPLSLGRARTLLFEARQ